MSFLMIWVIVKTKNEQQRTFARLKWICASYHPQTFSHALQSSWISFQAQIWIGGSVSKNLSVLANIHCWFTKSCFCTHLVTIWQFWGRIAKNEDFLRFPQLKMDCDFIRHYDLLFWKAYDLRNEFNTHYVTVECLKRKLWPLFLKTFF